MLLLFQMSLPQFIDSFRRLIDIVEKCFWDRAEGAERGVFFRAVAERRDHEEARQRES